MKKNGFTLIELLITIAIVGILIFVGVPSLRHLVAANRAITKTDHFVSALHLARSEAIKLGVKVKFCKSSDHKTCGGNWRDGQIIITADNKLVRTFAALPSNDQLIWNSSLGKDDYLEFTPIGNTNGQSGTFYYYPQGKSAYAKEIVISNTGRIRVTNVEKSL